MKFVKLIIFRSGFIIQGTFTLLMQQRKIKKFFRIEFLRIRHATLFKSLKRLSTYFWINTSYLWEFLNVKKFWNKKQNHKLCPKLICILYNIQYMKYWWMHIKMCLIGSWNWRIATNSNFLIPIFLQPDSVNLLYFKLR